ncbi:PTS glucose transporter subunit IIA [Demequina capsici]|uniref:PTS glucose transporter subunit IIA n=1 Tax=Demequina capsici TaxID=3075620 RepID=A0AA96FBC0_9MICO|nr:PTS glucose transporter subunit IIA [Demequina sp. PMTSA13]WNM26629.1 PTS glucose transporter subunit IIA [Demequina sp. PMTSA13]
MTTYVQAPTSGVVIPLAETSDPIFASGALGPGVAIRPGGETFVAPLAGTLVTVMPHAYGIAGDDGVEVLVHIGIDTVELEGRHFVPVVAKGQHVEAGDAFVTADLEAIAAAGFDTVTIVVVTNAGGLGAVEPVADGPVDAGAAVLKVSA